VIVAASSRTLPGATLLAATLALASPAHAALPPAPAPVSAPATPGVAPMVVTAEKQAAVEFAMVVALARSTIAQQCRQLPEPTSSRAAAALASWRARNQAWVTPTMSFVNYMAGIDATDKAQFQREVTRLIGTYKARAVVLARIELGADQADAANCAIALARFEDPTRDLARSAHAPELQAIRAYIEQLTTQGRDAKR